MHIQVQVGLGHVHCLYCGARKRVHSQLHSALFFRWTVPRTAGSSGLCKLSLWLDTQQVALQGVQRRDSLWTTWEVERRQLPLLPFLLIRCSSAAWLRRCHNCVHNLVVRLRGRPGDVNASDYMRKMLVDWYLIALPHLAAHSVAAVRERQCPGRLQLIVWLGVSC